MSFGARDLAIRLLPTGPGTGCVTRSDRCHPPSACPAPSVCQPPSDCGPDSPGHITWCTTTKEEDDRTRRAAGLESLRRQLRTTLRETGTAL